MTPDEHAQFVKGMQRRVRMGASWAEALHEQEIIEHIRRRTMISKDKQYKTRDGREVRIYAVDGAEWYSVHGAVKNNGGWVFYAWMEDGKFSKYEEGHNDLIEVKPRVVREGWVNVYKFKLGGMYDSKESAELFAEPRDRIACVKVVVDCEHGEGL